MTRHLFNFAAAVSLALAVFLSAVWSRSAAVHDRTRARLGDTRYTLHSHRHRLTLTAPPRPRADSSTAAAEDAARAIVALLKNTDVGWDEYRAIRRGVTAVDRVAIRYAPGSAAEVASSGDAAAYRRPLLAALEDPDRFVAAHAALVGHESRWPAVGAQYLGAGKSACDYDGLPVDLLPAGTRFPDSAARYAPVLMTLIEHHTPESWRVDPAKRAAVRDLWHERLDTPLVTFSHGWVVAGILVLPTAWLASSLRRMHRARNGLCVRCGYDLRESPDQCPECGAPAVPLEPA